MDGPSIIALSGQIAMQSHVDVVANNVANLQAPGYRADRMLFQSFISQLDVPGRQVAFVHDRATYIDAAQGNIEATGNPLDMAINGDGFFAVERPGGAGNGYSRDGRFKIGPDRTLVDNLGRAVLDDSGGRITIPERISKLEVRADGQIIATVNRRTQTVARIALTRAENPQAIRKSGDGLYDIPADQRRPVDPLSLRTRLVQGSIEHSSVQPIAEISNLSDLQRAYERMQKIVYDDDNRLRKMIEILGRTG